MKDLKSQAEGLFDPTTVLEIGKISGLEPQKLETLISQFEAIGRSFRAVILATPTNFNLGPSDRSSTERQNWLTKELLQPIERIQEAIRDAPMLSAIPEKIPSNLTDGEWTELRRLLTKLQTYASELRDSLEARSADSSTVNAELRFDLVDQLAEACRKAGIPMARNYVAGHGGKSRAARIIGLACTKITGAGFSVDHQLRDYLKFVGRKDGSSHDISPE